MVDHFVDIGRIVDHHCLRFLFKIRTTLLILETNYVPYFETHIDQVQKEPRQDRSN